MSFDSLAKLYYKDEKQHFVEYGKRYNAPFAYHLNFTEIGRASWRERV